MTRTRAAWSKTVESHGVSVRVYERAPGSVLYREVRDGTGGKSRKSLGHTDRTLAVAQAKTLAERLAELRHAGHTGPVTLGQLIRLHALHRLPLLSPTRQRTVRGMTALLERHFGAAFSVEDLSPHHVEAYTKARTSGAVRSARHRGPATGVRMGTVRNEVHLLASMLRWARGHRVGGRRLLTVDPLEGVRAPQEKNARRPVATEARYRAALAQAAAVDPRGRFGTILTMARHTGRRINAICQLRAADVCLTRDAVVRALAAAGQPVAHAEHWPHGAIRWASTTDKLGFEAVTPIGAEVRVALERYLRASPRLGDAPLFPATGDDGAAVHKVLAGYWLRRAETLAGLPKLERGGYHTLRRLWASERRHLPAQDVAAAGGWRSLQVMRAAYQHADAATVYAVLEPAPPSDLGAAGPNRDTARAEA